MTKQDYVDMTFEEAMYYLDKRERFASRLGLDKLREVLELLGNPDKGIPTIHIAGTNGKGSTCAYISYILAEAGYKVGLYSSPYVYEYGERIRVLDGHDQAKTWRTRPEAGYINKEETTRYLNCIRRTIESVGYDKEHHPNHFEMLTLMAFLFYREHECDVLVLETGLGGRLDATNVIDPPEVATITAIGLDHTQRLGNTYVEIAGEKAGILKKGTQSLVLYDQYDAIKDHIAAADVEALFRHKAEELDIRFCPVRKNQVIPLSHDLEGQTFELLTGPLKGETLQTKLLARYEIYNAQLAIETVLAFKNTIDKDAIIKGLYYCYWPGRLERLTHNPSAFLDGGHNPQGTRALRESLDYLFPPTSCPDHKEVHLVCMMKDKDAKTMFQNMLKGGRVSHLVLSRVAGIKRAMEPEDMAGIVEAIEVDLLAKENYPEIHIVPDYEDALVEAWHLAQAEQAIIMAWGSFYQAERFRDKMRALASGQNEED
jgi:dihydrofolate synthase/folylpolyglutamate synthase